MLRDLIARRGSVLNPVLFVAFACQLGAATLVAVLADRRWGSSGLAIVFVIELLGLSTFAPDLFARRDALWAAGDPAHHELDDLLQYLGQFTFRAPVPGYRHNAAMVMKLRGWIESDAVPHGAPLRPASDLDVLADCELRD